MSGLLNALGDLLLVGTALALAVGGAAALGALVLGRRVLARRLGAGLVAIVALYGLALLAAALASRERVLAPGEEKSVAGFDPHLHFRVEGPVRPGPHDGVLVTVRARCDSRRAIQHPQSQAVLLVDSRGRSWAPVNASAGGVDPAAGHGPFGRSLGPGESCTTTLEFHPAPDAAGLRLLVGETDWLCALEIGHENSPLHGKTLLAMAGDWRTARGGPRGATP